MTQKLNMVRNQVKENSTIDYKDYFYRFIAESKHRERFIASCVEAYTLQQRWTSAVNLFQAEIVKRKCSAAVSILDIGYNLGEFIFYLNDLFGDKYNLEFTGIELSEEAITVANEKKRFFGAQNFTFGVSNAEELSLEDESYDIVLCSEVLEHLVHPERAISEIYRVLKRGGATIIATPNKAFDPQTILKLPKLVDRVLFQGRFQRGEKEEQKFRVEAKIGRIDRERFTPAAGFGHISEKTTKEWTKLLREANFEKVKARKAWPILMLRILNDYPFLLGIAIIIDQLINLLPPKLNHRCSSGVIFEAYIYLGSLSIEKKEILLVDVKSARRRTMEYINSSQIVDDRNKIYNNGGAQVYY